MNVWRNRLIAAGCVLLALVGAFSAGRFSSPGVVATAVRLEAVRVEVKTEVEKKVYVKGETKIVWRDKSTDPKTGIVTEHEIEKTATDVSLTSNTERTATLNEATSKTETKTVTNLPRWRVYVGVGAGLHAPLLPIAGPLMFSIGGEYRIIGGLAAGVLLTTGGELFATVSFAF